MPLSGKKIILGVCGSIAAYKSALIVRLLVRGGAEVRVLMTAAAADFISPLTLSTLSRHAVYQSVHGAEGWNNHVELGLWADAMIIAPATAATLGKLANGICDNMIVAVYLSARCPVFFAPAMDVDMWHHPATQANVSRLQGYGNHLIPVEAGELASGLVGDGRLAEPETIVRLLKDFLGRGQDLSGRRILITAGPTREALDPVRYLSNHSTGSMGLELA
ncbi:MAG: bifunctional phosphopantothenoylcysteine decarboxylase/phosphopantothenate--cysteine ligase CoaBC, partial [Saprospiraceae bacterium]